MLHRNEGVLSLIFVSDSLYLRHNVMSFFIGISSLLFVNNEILRHTIEKSLVNEIEHLMASTIYGIFVDKVLA